MTIALTLIALIVGPPDARGGHAAPARDHGGHATPVVVDAPVRKLARFAAWVCIHEHEGRWNANTGNGYHGGLQMNDSFMRTYGADMIKRHNGGLAETWTPAEQITVAERAYVSGRGFGPWPMTRRMCGV